MEKCSIIFGRIFHVVNHRIFSPYTIILYKGVKGAPASDSEDAGQRKAAGVVIVALPAGVLLQPAQHDVAPAPVLEAVGRVQDIAQVQREGPCASASIS